MFHPRAVRRVAGLALVLGLLAASAAPADERRAELRAALSRDPVHVHVLADSKVQVGAVRAEQQMLVEEIGSLSRGALVLVSSEPGIPWERDVDLRAVLVAADRARDVIFVRPARAAEILREAEPEVPPDFEVTIRRWIDQLGSAQWMERQQATQVLLRFGQTALPLVRDGRVRTDDLEIRWRLEKIAQETTKEMVLSPGFLGIAYHYETLQLEDGPEGAVSIQQVLGGTQAEAAGLRSDDLLYEINEKPVANPFGTRKITKIFEGLRSGEAITLSVLRGGERVHLVARMGTYQER